MAFFMSMDLSAEPNAPYEAAWPFQDSEST
jgi:hypothetical protein